MTVIVMKRSKTMHKGLLKLNHYLLLATAVLSLEAFAVNSPDCRLQYMRQYVNDFDYIKEDDYLSDFEVLFFDLDGDGNEEALIADKINRDRSGNGWAITRRNATTGKIESHPRRFESGLSVFSHSWKLYVVTFDGTRDRLYGNDVMIYDIKNFGARNGTQNIYRDNVLLRMDTNGLLRATSVKNGFSDLVSNSGFKRLDRAVTEFYKGKDVKFVKRTEAATDISLHRPKGLEWFVRKYREAMKRRFGVDRKVTVYAIFLDADNDGDADFYMSSDVEVRKDGQYGWHLYLNDGGKFPKVEKVIWFNAGKEYNRESINPDEIAFKNSFYRVQRMYGFSPSVVILDHDGDNLHSRASRRQMSSQPPLRSAKYLSHDQEKEYYHALEEWRGNQKLKLGFIPAYDFEELIIRPEFLRLERLQCEEFPEQ